jgi:hydrogenase maturation protease
MTPPRILVACIGNIFLGDDGFGVEVAKTLLVRTFPPNVTVKDFGIRGFDLAYALLDPCDLTIPVDACARGGAPGTVYLIEPDPIDEAALRSNPARMEGHGMNPMNVLRLVKSLGGEAGHVMIVGCEPGDLGSDEEAKMGLSEPVMAAVDEAIALIDTLISKRVDGEPVATVAHSL